MKEMHCDYILYTTFERMFLTFYEETKDKPPVSMLNTKFLASVEYVKQYTTERAIKIFLQTWLNVHFKTLVITCKLFKTRIQLQ